MALTWKISKDSELRISALIALIFTSSGSISSLILSQYPADKFPSVKLICLILAIGGLLASVWQSQNKRMIVNPNEVQLAVKDAKLEIQGEVREDKTGENSP